MEYIYLICATCFSATLSIMSSVFNTKNAEYKNASSLYNAIATIGAFLSWGAIYILNFEFDPGVLWYSLAYGVFYTMALMGLFKALEVGSLSLTALVKQLSLIGVAFWGLFFWEIPFTKNVLTGLIIIVIALYLCFKPDKNMGKATVSLKWLLFAGMLLVGNAGCSIVQKYQQMHFDGKFGSMLMFFGTCFSAISCMILYFKSNNCKLSEISKKTLLFPVIGGTSSTMLNLFIILLISTPMSESIIFPGIAVGGLILTTLFSVIFQKEKLYIHQWIGISIGAMALVFLNM